VLDPAWLNFFENPKMVQFVHRIGGYLLWVLVLLQWIVTVKMASAATHKRRAAILFALVTLQAAIGIFTLLSAVPLPLALLHQAGAVILLAFAVAHWRALNGGYTPRYAIEIRR
jgi:cytochrome c oxidase assembly protein subunit 15